MYDPVPMVKNIDQIYYPDDLPSEKKRFAHLLDRYFELYSKKPDFVARSPGRVNIIGEQIDHQLYEVLPMAMASDVLIAVSTRTDVGEAKVSLSNLNPQKFKPGNFSIPSDGNVEIDSSTLEWTNYFKAGFQGAVGLLRKSNPKFSPRSMDVLIDGNVPSGAGLSSSAAFVCASALAVLRANGQKQVIKKDLVELAIVSERGVGVNSGGMDQSASVFSIQGDAVSVAFSPHLHAEAISFPKTDPPMTFMVANSFVAADKHDTAPINYNLRVVECTLAAEYLAALHSVTLTPDAGALGVSLRGFQTAYFASHHGKNTAASKDPKAQLERMLAETATHLTKKEGYTRDEIASTLSISVPELEDRFMTKFPVRAERFLLAQRAQHVFSEALRVLHFKDLLLAPPTSADTLLPRLGALMSETQDSCRDLFDNSTPELDQMCRIAKQAGSYGGRVTGAGFGGCTVHLVPKDKVEAITLAWEEGYYWQRGMGREKMEEKAAVVVSEPGHGSML